MNCARRKYPPRQFSRNSQPRNLSDLKTSTPPAQPSLVKLKTEHQTMTQPAENVSASSWVEPEPSSTSMSQVDTDEQSSSQSQTQSSESDSMSEYMTPWKCCRRPQSFLELWKKSHQTVSQSAFHFHENARLLTTSQTWYKQSITVCTAICSNGKPCNHKKCKDCPYWSIELGEKKAKELNAAEREKEQRQWIPWRPKKKL
jgi:hypothetical protein